MSKIIIKYNNLAKLAKRLPLEVDTIVKTAAFAVEGYAKDIAPFDTGALRGSIKAESKGIARAVIAPHKDYAAFLEYGTRKMKARPYMRPAAEKIAPQFFNVLRNLENKLR